MTDIKGGALRQLNALLNTCGVQLERTTKRRSVVDFLVDRGVNVVYDVGANQGQFAKEIRKQGFRGKIISFEPLRDAFQHLLASSKADSLWEAYNVGLSEQPGRSDINVSKYSVFSSLMPMNSSALQFNADAEFIRKESIELNTLDSVFTPCREAMFLKIDTQGHEKAVLEGAGQCLTKFCGILMELPIVQLYEGVWQFEEAVAYMRARGFLLSNVLPNNFDLASDPVSLLEVDCVFKNIA